MLNSTCPICHNPVRPGARFCGHCRASLSLAAPPASGATVACSRCGTRNRVGARFCAKCGQTLAAVPAQKSFQSKTGAVIFAGILLGVSMVAIIVAAIGFAWHAANTSASAPVDATSTRVAVATVPTTGTPPASRMPTATSAPTPPAVGVRVGNLAPDFTLLDSTGKPVALSSLRGKPVILNFWASWCPYCRKEMPDLDALYQDDSAKYGLVVLGIDTNESDRADAETFVRDYRLSFPILWDEGIRVSELYRLRAYPSSIFIDRAGIIRATVEGVMTRADMNAHAKKIY